MITSSFARDPDLLCFALNCGAMELEQIPEGLRADSQVVLAALEHCCYQVHFALGKARSDEKVARAFHQKVGYSFLMMLHRAIQAKAKSRFCKAKREGRGFLARVRFHARVKAPLGFLDILDSSWLDSQFHLAAKSAKEFARSDRIRSPVSDWFPALAGAKRRRH